MRRSITFLGSFYPPYAIGGAERMFQIHTEGFALKGYNVTIITLGEGTAITKEIRKIKDQQITIYRLPIKNIYWPLGKKPGLFGKILWHIIDLYNPFHNKDIAKVLKIINPQIIICENLIGWSPSIWRFLHQQKITVIQITHDSTFLCTNGIMLKNGKNCNKRCLKCKVLRYPYKFCSKYVNHFIFVSNTQKNRFIKMNFVPRQYSVVFNAEPIKLTTKETKWNKQRTFHLGFLATLAEGKGIINLIRAFKQLKGDFDLSIGGKAVSEDFHNTILKEIGNDRRIKLLGYVNYEEYLKKIDLMIIPSIVYESFGLVAVEACANQIPVVAANRGGLSEIIQDSINGVYCNPENINSIASAIQKVYDNSALYEQLKSKTHSSIKDYVDVNRMLNKIEQIFLQYENSNRL